LTRHGRPTQGEKYFTRYGYESLTFARYVISLFFTTLKTRERGDEEEKEEEGG
jgi:hypothetical protein